MIESRLHARVTARRPPAARGPAYAAETLEVRRLLAAFGPLNGFVEFQDNVTGRSNPRDEYQFSLPAPARLFARASNLADDVELAVDRLVGFDFITPQFERVTSADGDDFIPLEVDLTPGDYAVHIRLTGLNNNFQGTDYRLQIWPDYAGDTLGQARDVGTLVGPVQFGDFVHGFDGGEGDDYYRFSLPSEGRVTAHLFGMSPGAQSRGADLRIIRDANNNGAVDAGEVLASDLRAGASPELVIRTLAAGTYFAEVVPSPGGYTNYALALDNTPTDRAGQSLAAARNIGTLGAAQQTFADFLGTPDATDVYRFTAGGGGPFNFTAGLTGLAAGANATLELIRDVDGDNVVESGEVLARGTEPANAEENIRFTLPAAGTYFVRAQRVAGNSAYSLALANVNTDRAGNTLAAAANLGALPGRVAVAAETVSPADGADVYRFTTAVGARVQASFGTPSAAADINLELVRDFDGDGTVDPGDVLASSRNPGTAAESINTAINAGTYFVRVLYAFGNPAASVALTLSVDGAGETLGAARPLTVGTTPLAVIDFVGTPSSTFPGGDAADVYRLGVGSNRRLRLFLSNLKGDVNLQIVRDRDGDNVIDAGDTLATTTNPGKFPDALGMDVAAAGTYFVRVVPVGTGSNYTLTLGTGGTDFAGNTLAGARDLGVAPPVGGSVDGAVAADDLADVYHFALGPNAPYDFSANLEGQSADADLELIRDDDADNVVDPGEVLAFSNSRGTANDLTRRTLYAPGRYFLRVTRDPNETGEPSYRLRYSAVSLDTADNALATARNLGSLPGAPAETSHAGFAGAGDTDDFFRFSVSGARRLEALLVGLTDDLDLDLIRDQNANNVIDAGDTLATAATAGSDDDEMLSFVLPTFGGYFVRVRRPATAGAVGTDYELILRSFPPPPPGISGSVFEDFDADGAFDAGEVKLPSVVVYLDNDNDANQDPGEPGRTTNADGNYVFDDVGTGTRRVRVVRPTGFSTQPTLPAGGVHVVTLSAGQVRSDVNFGLVRPASAGGVVFSDADGDGARDAGEGGIGGVTVYQDANNNGARDGGEPALTTAATTGAWAFTVLAPGTSYVFRQETPAGFTQTAPAGGSYSFSPNSGDAATNFDFGNKADAPVQSPFNGTPFQVSATAATTIQAEEFDFGGEGVAYHDTTPGNAAPSGGAFRTTEDVDVKSTADAGGGFRLSGTRAGEFVEFTVDVAESAPYDIDFRVASPEPGVRLRLDVDGADATGEVAVPDTNGFDAMATVTRAGVALPAGRHVLRLTFAAEAPANSNAGSVNFIRIRPASTGQPVTLGAAADAHVRGGASAGTNFGGNAQLEVKSATDPGFAREAYFKFDLTNVALASIGSAKLRLFGMVQNTNAANIQTQVFGAADSSWSETAITYNNRPTTGAAALASATITDAVGRFYEWDVTEYLQAEKAAGRDLVTLVLRAAANTNPFVAFNSREAGVNTPGLVIAP